MSIQEFAEAFLKAAEPELKRGLFGGDVDEDRLEERFWREYDGDPPDDSDE